MYKFLLRSPEKLAAAIIVLMVASMVTLYFIKPPPLSANDSSRWATVERLVFSGTYVINESYFSNTVDRIATVDEAGRTLYYSSKPAFLATWISGVAYVFDLIGLQVVHPQQRDSRITMGLILIIVNYIPFGLIIWFYFKYLRQQQVAPWIVVVSFLTAATGTYFSGYLSVLNNHTQGMIFVFAALLVFESYRADPETNDRYIWLAGLFSGLAIAHETAAILWGVVLLALVARKSKGYVVWQCGVAFLIPVLLWAASEYAAFGTGLPKQVHSILGWDHPFHIDDYWQIKADVDSYHDPLPVRAFHMLFGHHGFFSLTPIFLFVLIPYFLNRAAWSAASRKALFVVMTLSTLSFLVFWLKTSNYGGLCQGFRWLFWLIPFWLMLLPHALRCLPTGKPLWKGMAFAALGMSIYSATLSLLSPWSISWLDLWLRPELLQFM